MTSDQDNIRQLSERLEAIQAQIQELTRQRETLAANKLDLEGAIDALERLESGANVQVPLGGSTYVRAEIQDIDEVIVSLGADYAAEQPREGAIETLKERNEHIEERLEEITEELAELQSEGAELEQQAQQLAQQQQLGSPAQQDIGE